MDNDDITFDSLTDASQLNAPVEPKTVESVAESTPSTTGGDALTLAELNQALGKNFPNKEAAIKAYKDTFSYVGKKQEDIEREVLAKVNGPSTDALAKELAQIKKDMFYKDNPQFAPYRATIDKIGGNPSDVVNDPSLKEIFEKAQGFDQSQNLRTVLESNPRIASSKSSLDKAREMQAQGARQDDVEKLVADAVLDAFSK